MEWQQMMDRLKSPGIVPVIRIEEEAQAVPLAKALCRGGLPLAEVTFRTQAAAGAIARMKEACPEMLLGAGTVLTPEQAASAVEAGASFVVSPGLNPAVVEWCQGRGVPVIPGCATATEMEAAMRLGLSAVKFFPAEAAGGLKALKALSAPYGGLRFMPTGGITSENMGDYLRFGPVFCCGGSFIVPDALLRAGDFAGIEGIARRTVAAIFDFRIESAGLFGEKGPAHLFGGLFAGAPGEVTVSTPQLSRALLFFAQNGAELAETEQDGAGRICAARLETGGGARLWLRQR